jgi:uncharacterized damage-inducible protein DinB
MSSVEVEKHIVMPPSGYEPVVARWMWVLEDSRKRTKSLLVGLSQNALDWVPKEGGNSIGTILYHLASIEMSYIYEDILEIGWAPELEGLLPYDIRDEQGLLVKLEDENLEAHMDRLDATRILTMRHLKTLSKDELYRVRRVADYETTPEWVLHHLMQHEGEHRGQIGELRLRAERSGQSE